MSTQNQDAKDLVDLLEIDSGNVIDSFVFDYNSGERWGFVDTPADRASKPIAERVSHDFPYISGRAIYEILTHIFDNVVNYRPIGQDAKGTILLSSNDKSLEIVVANLTDRTLPPTLNDRIYTVTDGVITVPSEERDVETGGGNGVNAVTKTLPYVYSSLVETESTASVSWRQIPNQVIFTLSIPTPSEDELARCKDYMFRREEDNKAFDQARPYIIETKNPDGTDKAYEITIRAGTAIPVLRDALRACVNFPENHKGRFFELVDVLRTIQVYGQEASSASQDVIDIILSDAAAVHGMDVLTAIEEREGMYCDRFASIVENYQGEGEMSLRVMVKYLTSNLPPEDYSDKLIELYFNQVVRSMQDRLELLRGLPDGKLKETAVEKIAEAGVDQTFYICQALESVDGRLHRPLVGAIVVSKSAYYAYETLANERVSVDFHPQLVDVITDDGSAYYAYEALANERVSSSLHHQLVHSIVKANSNHYASQALALENMQDTALRTQLESINIS